MNNVRKKAATIKLLNTMIEHADKGPSGFWTDDYEGCGNPAIFPEFDDGLKKGNYTYKDHYLCPWNTAVMYGEGRGNINTGCYHSCSIHDARLLSGDLVKKVLIRFRDNLESGKYDDINHIDALLTEKELNYMTAERQRQEKEQEEKEQKRKDAASSLIKKYQGNEEAISVIESGYGTNTLMLTESFGCIAFNKDNIADIVGGEKLTYDDYIDIQIQTGRNVRGSFQQCYYEIPMRFKGKIEKISNNKVCFNKIYVDGMYSDGLMFEGKEDHVWMDLSGFENFQVGDSLEFSAEIYRYLKTGNGKAIDFGLRNPSGIKKIDGYELPTDEELKRQEIETIVCDTCFLNEHCNGLYCLLPKGEKQKKVNMLMKL